MTMGMEAGTDEIYPGTKLLFRSKKSEIIVFREIK